MLCHDTDIRGDSTQDKNKKDLSEEEKVTPLMI
jgi:hypothetical protein